MCGSVGLIGSTSLAGRDTGAGTEGLVLAIVAVVFVLFGSCFDICDLVADFSAAVCFLLSSPSKGEPFRIEPRPWLSSSTPRFPELVTASLDSSGAKIG